MTYMKIRCSKITNHLRNCEIRRFSYSYCTVYISTFVKGIPLCISARVKFQGVLYVASRHGVGSLLWWMYSVYVYEALLILCKVHISNRFDLDPCEFCALTPGYTSSPMHMPSAVYVGLAKLRFSIGHFSWCGSFWATDLLDDNL